MPTPLRACVIGCMSKWYQGTHHPTMLRLAGRVRLAAASALEPDAPPVITGKLGFERAYADVAEMLEKEKPDFVWLCVSPKVTPVLACQVLERRIPLITEKPVADSLAAGRRVAEAARAAGVPNMVAFNRRWSPLLRRARELAAARGGVTQYACEFLRHDTTARDDSIGSLQHATDALRFLGGDVAAASVMPGSVRYFDNVAVATSWHLRFASGATGALVHNVRAGRPHERYRIFAENWTATVSLAGPMICDDRLFLEVEEGGRLVERVGIESFPPEQRTAIWLQGYQGETEHFVECLERGRRPEPDVAEAVRSLELDELMVRAKRAALAAT